MKKLYTHENRMIIFNLKNVLDEAGINALVMNEFSSGGAGELATFDTWPELWIENEQQFDQAEKILRDIVFEPKESDWFCRGCQEKNGAAFQICWNCGRAFE